jgi:hypothetical protein
MDLGHVSPDPTVRADAGHSPSRRVDVASDIVHPCEASGCRQLALRRHCRRHETDDDRAELRALCEAIDEATELEERWRAARRRVHDLKRAAGIATPGNE